MLNLVCHLNSKECSDYFVMFDNQLLQLYNVQFQKTKSLDLYIGLLRNTIRFALMIPYAHSFCSYENILPDIMKQSKYIHCLLTTDQDQFE
jgi:hypothetical protein